MDWMKKHVDTVIILTAFAAIGSRTRQAGHHP